MIRRKDWILLGSGVLVVATISSFARQDGSAEPAAVDPYTAAVVASTATPVSVRDEEPKDPESDTLFKNVELSLADHLGKPVATETNVSIVGTSGPWTFGIVVITAPDVEGAAPDMLLFLAKRKGPNWGIAFEHSATFREWVLELPDELISKDGKSVLGDVGDVAGQYSPKLSLPWAADNSWRLTGGPHGNTGTARPWSALDFNRNPGESVPVRAAREGVVWRSDSCPDFVRIDHANGWQTGYYHLVNEAVINGQSVSRGQLLGSTSTESGCGGSATAPHVHFTLRRNGIHQELDGVCIGGWLVREGSAAYGGYMASCDEVVYPSGLIHNWCNL